MSTAVIHKYPALHNAMWPGLVGKGPDSEPPIDLETMLNLTAGAEVDGTRFDGVDLFLFAPHVDIDSSDDDLKRLVDRIGNTPLLRLERASSQFPNVEIYAKAEWFNPGGSVKDRAAARSRRGQS